MAEQFFRGKPVSFDEAFPDIEEIKIEGTEGSMGNGLSEKSITLNKKTLGGIEPCSNRLCENGGYELGDFISEMYSKKETFKKDVISCKGHENFDRRQKRRCLNGFNVRAEIKYKSHELNNKQEN